MSMQTAADVPLNIVSDNSRSERRINPSWTITHLKERLEPITGLPSSSQRLTLNLGGSQSLVVISALDEETTQLSQFPLRPYAELNVADTRPSHLRAQQNYNDVSSVEKYVMPTDTYESMTSNTVLAYKRAHKLGRFDPTAPSQLEAQAALIDREIDGRDIVVGARCRLVKAETGQPEEVERRGEVAYVGEVEELPGVGRWVGVRLDEPTGKNDGSVKGKKYFDAQGNNRGVIVRPDRVEVGDFEVVDEFADEDMEEI